MRGWGRGAARGALTCALVALVATSGVPARALAEAASAASRAGEVVVKDADAKAGDQAKDVDADRTAKADDENARETDVQEDVDEQPSDVVEKDTDAKADDQANNADAQPEAGGVKAADAVAQDDAVQDQVADPNAGRTAAPEADASAANDAAAVEGDYTWNGSNVHWKVDGGVLTISNGILNGVDITHTTDDEGFEERAWLDCGQAITEVRFDNVKTGNNFGGFFEDMPDLLTIDVTGLDTSNAINLNRACSLLVDGYFNKSKVTSIVGLNELNVSNCQYMEFMFDGACGLTDIDISNWDTHSVRDFSHFCCFLDTLKSIKLPDKFVTNNANILNGMFENCKSLKSVDVHDWDVSSVESIQSMFYHCEQLRKLDVSMWNTSKIFIFNAVFNGCYLLEDLDVSGWDVSNAEYVEYMFFD